jgi:hypothetical protein
MIVSSVDYAVATPQLQRFALLCRLIGHDRFCKIAIQQSSQEDAAEYRTDYMA